MEPIENIRVIDLGDEQIVLDPARLRFNDASLHKFMEDLGIWYDYFTSKTAKAEELFANAELAREFRHDQLFLQAKSEGLTEKASEAYARTQDEVQGLHKQENALKSAVKQMKEYVKALDKAYSMAQNRGHMIRKEMDKLDGHRAQINIDDILGN